MFSATVGYKNTITVSNADREKVLNIMKSLPQQNDNMRIIGNTAYKDLPPADRRYINTDAETALQVANILSGDGKMKFSGRLNGSNATLTVVGDTNAAFVRRIIDNIQNMDLVNELREKGYERTADTNGFVNIRNMQRISGGDPDEKIYKLLTFAGNGLDVADPWYTGDFGTTYDDVLEGCTAFLRYLQQNGRIDM